MAAGLVGLLDDVAALAKLAAASIDDVGAAAGKASAKAAGVVVDDTAVTPAYVQGLTAQRELPIVAKIAKGSLRNKLLFVIPVALVLSEVAPILIEIILMAGGAFLCFEGAEKIYHKIKADDHDHDIAAVVQGPEAEAAIIASAVRTDLILSAEIMVISLKEVLDEGLLQRTVIMVIVALFITVLVYGVVALIVKMDDVGLSLAQRDSEISRRVGRRLVSAMPVLLKGLTVVGTAAMLWVGGHILIVGTHGSTRSFTTSKRRSPTWAASAVCSRGWSTLGCPPLSDSLWALWSSPSSPDSTTPNRPPVVLHQQLLLLDCRRNDVPQVKE